MSTTEYTSIFCLRNKTTGKMILTYWASSQKHKAIFSSRKKAEEAVSMWLGDNIEIVEIN